jgi:8-oxo-dGTP pyrophosphatase MutT (NUDIX family)
VEDFERTLREALAAPLPGLDAQLRMAPRPRHGWDPATVPPGLRDGAALLLVYPAEGVPHVPLTVRGARMRTHTGQVSLPGGGVHPEESIDEAALREAAEEVGIIPGEVRIVGRLTPLHVPVSGFLLHPVVGVAAERPAFQPAEVEVARILEVSLASLHDPSRVRRQSRIREHEGRPVEIDVPFFDVDGEEVWGATAMVLAEFLAVVSRVRGFGVERKLVGR